MSQFRIEPIHPSMSVAEYILWNLECHFGKPFNCLHPFIHNLSLPGLDLVCRWQDIGNRRRQRTCDQNPILGNANRSAGAALYLLDHDLVALPAQD